MGAGQWKLGPGRVARGSPDVVDDVAPLGQVIGIAGAQTDAEIDLHVTRGLFVKGRVEPPPGRSVGAGFVIAADVERGLRMFQTWNVDGTFIVGPCVDGRFDLTAESHSGLGSSETVRVKPGQSDVVLRLHAGGSIEGRVLDGLGTSVGCVVVAGRREEFGSSLQYSEVPAGEPFRFTGLVAGVFDLAASTNDGRAGVLEGIDVADGAKLEGLVLRVIPAGSVRVRYEGPDRSAHADVLQHDVTVSGGHLDRGLPIVYTAPAGPVLVRVETSESNHILERTVTVDVGNTTEVVFDERPH